MIARFNSKVLPTRSGKRTVKSHGVPVMFRVRQVAARNRWWETVSHANNRNKQRLLPNLQNRNLRAFFSYVSISRINSMSSLFQELPDVTCTCLHLCVVAQ